MRRRSLFQLVLPRALAIAIVVVLGFLHVGPGPAQPISPAPLVTAVEQRGAGDALKIGHRLEPRVWGAPLLDRLPPVPATRPNALALADRRAARFDIASDPRSSGRLLPIVKHVPRLERGDPPRS